MVKSVLTEGVAVAQQLRKERAQARKAARAARRLAMRLRMHDKGLALAAPVFEEDEVNGEVVAPIERSSMTRYARDRGGSGSKRLSPPINDAHKEQIQRVLERIVQHRQPWRDKWITGSGEAITEEEMLKRAARHVQEGGKVYIGTDSGIREEKNWAIFCTAVCLHGARGQRGGQYLYRRTLVPVQVVPTLQARMTAETQHTIELAQQLVETHRVDPSSVELHLDIGLSEKSKTRTFAQTLVGYATGYGFSTKVKPEAWAAHNVADRHS